MSTVRVICICSGNICRTPMAVSLLREAFIGRNQSAVVISAGTLGLQGRRAAEFARIAMAEKGERWARHTDEHRSQGISPSLLNMADYILIMSPTHARFLEANTPQVLSRVVPVWNFSGQTPPLDEIADPVGKDLQAFRACRDLLEECLEHWLEQTLPVR